VGDKETTILEVDGVGKVTKRGSQKTLEEVEQIILVLDARKVSHTSGHGRLIALYSLAKGARTNY